MTFNQTGHWQNRTLTKMASTLLKRVAGNIGHSKAFHPLVLTAVSIYLQVFNIFACTLLEDKIFHKPRHGLHSIDSGSLKN